MPTKQKNHKSLRDAVLTYNQQSNKLPDRVTLMMLN